jgi:hypothetical protein
VQRLAHAELRSKYQDFKILKFLNRAEFLNVQSGNLLVSEIDRQRSLAQIFVCGDFVCTAGLNGGINPQVHP